MENMTPVYDEKSYQTVADNSAAYCPPDSAAPLQHRENIAPMGKKDICFTILFFAFSFVFIDFAVAGGFNLGFTISYFIIFILATVYLFKKNVKATAFTYMCGMLSLLGAVTFALFSDTLVNFIMIFLVFGLFAAYCCSLSGTFRHSTGSFRVLFDIAGAAVHPVSDIPRVSKALGKSMKSHKNVKSAVIGIALSVPVLFVIIPLLVSSDAAFEGLVTSVFVNIGKYILEGIAAVIITPYVISFMYGKKEKLNTGTGVKKTGVRRLQSAFSVSFLSVISLTYMVYLFSQLAYFFSTFSGILPDGWEYSASTFARRGFFEMFFISVINMAIISAVSILTKRNERGSVHAGVKALSLFIMLFSVLLIITAMSKMKLNIEMYGLSKNRLLVAVFMVMLLIVTAFYIIHIFAPRISYMQPIIIICSAMFIALSFADIDAVVAKYNVSAYQSGKIETVDVDYLGNLSDSAVPYIAELAMDSDLKDTVYLVLRDRMMYTDGVYFAENGEAGETAYYEKPDFRSFNFSTDKACRALCDYYNKYGFEFEMQADVDEIEQWTDSDDLTEWTAHALCDLRITRFPGPIQNL